MTEQMHKGHLPWPQTRSLATLNDLLADPHLLAQLSFPLIIKSRYSKRGDLVDKIHTGEQLRSLATQWGQEPIIVQDFVAGDGWDIKLWVIDERLFAARRRTPLEANAAKTDFIIPSSDIPEQWRHIVLEIGHVFDLRLYGVDLLLTEQEPMIIDVNAFPGFRGVPGADAALVALVERLLTKTY